MPELPEVEAARCLAERTLKKRRIVKVTTVADPIVYTGLTPRRFATAMKDRKVLAVRRRGKHLWFELDERPWPAFHFGMTGYFDVYRNVQDRPRFLKMELLLDNATRFALSDARRLGRIRLLDDPENSPPISALGCDPLLDDPRGPWFREQLRRRKAPIKAALLDQSLAAGVGNWIADEVLYQARVNPHRRGCDLSDQEARRLHRKLLLIIRKAVAVDGDNDRYPHSWLFHYRWGKDITAVTHRKEKILHETIGGRTTAWVPSMQK